MMEPVAFEAANGHTMATTVLAARDERRFVLVLLGLTVIVLVLLGCAVAFGSVDLPFSSIWSGEEGSALSAQAQLILVELRLPAALTAVVAGVALAASGLQMQTYFQNPLAGPFVLGVDSGASLGVALMLLGLPLLLAVFPGLAFLKEAGMVLAAVIGAAVVLAFVAAVARYTLSDAALVIVGLMLSLLVGSVVSVLLYYADPMRLQAFVIWTFGSFGGVSWVQLPIFAALVSLGLALAAFEAKALNGLLLGPLQAASLGVDQRRVRRSILLSTALLAGTTTAFCGPLGVLGTAVPHLARGLLGSSDHRRLLPVCALAGAAFTLFADVLSRTLAAHGTLPLNAMLAVLSAPVVIAVLVRLNRPLR